MPENWREGRSRSRRARGRAVAVRMPLARRTDLGDSNYAGLEVDVCHDLQRCLRDTLDAGFDFLVTPLAHPRHRRPAPSARDPSSPQPAPFARSDLLLNSSQWIRRWWARPPVDRPRRRLRPLPRQRGCAPSGTRVGSAPLLHAVLLPRRLKRPTRRLVNQFLGALSTALWVRVPVVAPEVESAEARDADSRAQSRDVDASARNAATSSASADAMRAAVDGPTRRRVHDPFERWANLRALCEGHSQLGACLEIGATLPPAAELDRWVGGPVASVVVSPRVRVQQAGISRALAPPEF